VLSSFFQGWDQGLEAFGDKGMKKLWSAANIRVAGSGLSDSAFLPFLSQLIGDHDVIRRSSSTQKGGRSVSTSVQRERLLDVNDLAALPRGRAVLSTSGLPPALVELQHYSTRPYGDDVEASKELPRTTGRPRCRHDPTAPPHTTVLMTNPSGRRVG
jgi:type IV secretory pathway TraG/TraD family ATPase VirD4